MANPSTTHVIEIETGIGEPAFIPLTLGQELQPISVGKKGMWRIESPSVRDVHAFVYFDGSSLFLQSADEAAAAMVDGFRIGKAWTELHAPCKIDIGGARLRYRSLLPDNDSGMTVVKGAPPVQGQPGGGPPRPAAGAPSAPPRPAAGAPPPPGQGSNPSNPAPSAPASFPKADRPFKPGEFSSPADDESTRFAPADAQKARTGASASYPARMPGAQPVPEIDTRQDAIKAPMQRSGGSVAGPMPGQPAGNSGAYAPIGAGPMQGGMQQSMPPMMGGPQMGMAPPMMQQSMPPGYPQGNPQMGNPQMSYPPNFTPGSGAYGAMGPGGQMMGGPSMPPGGYGSMTPQNGMINQPPPQGGMAEMVAKYKEMSMPRRIMVILLPIAMLLAVYTLFFDEPEPPPKKPTAQADAGVDAGGTAATNPVVPPVGGTVPPVGGGTTVTAAGACPPPQGWPPGAPFPTPGLPPSVVNWCNGGAGSSSSGGFGSPDSGGVLAGGKDAGATKPPKNEKDAGGGGGHDVTMPATKTLERQAVDAVAAGRTAEAAALYEELSRRDPKNLVYAEAARILRNKLDAGVN